MWTSFGASIPFGWVSSQVTVSIERPSSSDIWPGVCPSAWSAFAFVINSSRADMEKNLLVTYLSFLLIGAPQTRHSPGSRQYRPHPLHR